jgi:hypothetical protein
VLTNVTDVRVLQYALLLLRDFLLELPGDAERRARLAVRIDGGAGGNALPLLQLAGTSGSGARILSLDANAFVLENAAMCAAALVAAGNADETATSGLLSWVLSNLKLFGSHSAAQVRVTEVAVEALMVVLRSEAMRDLFLLENGVQMLLPMLSARNSQLLYDASHCLWLISLHRLGADGAGGAGGKGAESVVGVAELEREGAVKALVRLCRLGMPLKVMRMALAVLANVVRAARSKELAGDLSETHLPELVASLLAQEPRITDPELLDDLSLLAEAMAAAVAGGAGGARAQSAVQRLEAEVATRRLDWGVLHTPEFWKENASRVEAGGGFTLIRQLADLLQSSGSEDGQGVDDVTAAVALFDLGEFASAHPQGKAILHGMGVKPLVMSFLKRTEDDVKHQALLALSKMMVTRWQFVGQAGSAGAAARS